MIAVTITRTSAVLWDWPKYSATAPTAATLPSIRRPIASSSKRARQKRRCRGLVVGDSSCLRCSLRRSGVRRRNRMLVSVQVEWRRAERAYGDATGPGSVGASFGVVLGSWVQNLTPLRRRRAS
jgi:hypothetical protein